MGRQRFDQIKRFLHFNDNSKAKKPGEQGFDKLYKIRLVLGHIRSKFLEVTPEEHHSIDEQMIPFKGRSNLRQYLPKKPTMWGIKVFTRAGVSEFPIIEYTGKQLPDTHKLPTRWGRQRFDQIKRFLHFNDNSKAKKPGEQGFDKLYKIRLVLGHIRSKFLEVTPEEHHSIDEQMIPFKGRSNLRQYLPKKPTMWGIKVFTRAGVSGFVHDFEI
ncbi:hypothetical protein QYM36_012605 [Artemia franciscana]|uniref:PiggyBac transposable element-derived protein domain-containing protein n=1 Tax=Artemia franciscana TaxID=6661 RepID=A0AA88HV94_ARTSF|nr:hypothetical protein QYM36_012605 [Artemia franciscana]